MAVRKSRAGRQDDPVAIARFDLQVAQARNDARPTRTTRRDLAGAEKFFLSVVAVRKRRKPPVTG